MRYRPTASSTLWPSNARALVTGPLTGGSFNPARSLGPAVAGGGWTAHWLYWVAPVAGMLVAARLYEYLRGTNPPAVVPPGVPLGVEGPLDGSREEPLDVAG